MANLITEHDTRELSTAELISRATDQLSLLVRDELALAKAEILAKAKPAGVGAGLFGGAGAIALYGLGTLVAAAVLGVAAGGLALWLAALIVAAGLFLLAGVLVAVGRSQLRRASSPVPHDALSGLRADIDMVKTAVREGHAK
ncbi:phage holin family protein [Pilimelia columellifera]|uniref:Phage holin family protein n=1 Tax=Pilimelia columellifera subsp. columellifera TaxID=706583 RepID=A0ABP6AT88_9ACTN